MRRRWLPLAILVMLGASLAPAPAFAAPAAQPGSEWPWSSQPVGISASQPETSRAIPQAVESPPAVGDEPTHKNPKADWQVASVVESEASGAATALAVAGDAGLSVSGGRIRVIVETSDLAQAMGSIGASGATTEGAAANLVQVRATPSQLKAIVAAAGVSYVRAPLPHFADAVAGEGVGVTNAVEVQAAGNTGAGVKIAVIDGGFAGLAAAQASGDLPTVTQVDYCDGGFSTATQHGTAVAEIVHEMAPGAALYLICISTEVELANAEAYVKANGISIVNHSVAWFNTSRGDGSGGAGTPDATVADANANGILWVNAAGNDATGHWSGTFVSDGTPSHPWHNFGGGDIGNTFTLASGASTCALLKWNSWPTTNQDYDLYVFRSSDGAYWYSENVQNGSQPPTEALCLTNSGPTQTFYVGIRRWSATSAPRFDLYVWGADLQYQVAAGSVAEPASSSAAFAVGAVCWNASTIEYFSSRGPTIDGRIKPDISGPDQVSGTTYGAFTGCGNYAGFPGTSAASPHVAGAAALVKGIHPAYTPAQLRTYLQTHAIDLGVAGNDSTYGYGMLWLPGPPDQPTAVSGIGYNQSVLVSWTAPASNGGATITGYTVTASPDGATCTTTGATSCTVTGLTNGTPYTFTVTATNEIGTGDPSAASAPATPVAVPDAPIDVTAVGWSTSAAVSWTAPADNGSAITGYTATATPGGQTCATAGLTCTITGLTNYTTYTIGVTATNGNGTGPAGTTTVMPVPRGTYVTVSPNRLVDSRVGTRLGLSASLNHSSAVSFQVTDRFPAEPGKNIPANAIAVTGNLTAVNEGASGYFSLTPAAPVGAPTTSTINFPRGDVRANAVTVPLGAGGTLWIIYVGAAGTHADVIFDVTGYFLPDSSGATYLAVTPNRLVDSRVGTRLGLSASLNHNSVVSFQVTDRFPAEPGKNIPANAIAVTGNLTAVQEGARGYFSLTPAAPVGEPTTSTINFPRGDTRANAVTVPLGPDGKLWIIYIGAAGTHADVIFDVTGYFVPDTSGATYVPAIPNRLVDSRVGTRLGLSASLNHNSAVSFQVTGRVPADASRNIPATAIAVTGNLTAVNEGSGGYFSLTPAAPVGAPTTSTINFPKGDTRANAVAVPLGAGGKLWIIYIGAAGTHADVIFDVTGYFEN